MSEDGTHEADGFAGVPYVVPRPAAELAPLLDWLRAGRPAGERLDFTAGTALPDGRLDLCKQDLGAEGAPQATTATRFVLGQGIATSVKRRLDALAAHVPPPTIPADVRAVRSVHRTTPAETDG